MKHRGFVRSLARSLVRDEHRADDLVQETWLAALEQPPGILRSPRSWLARVVRNFARMAYRKEHRRSRHERGAPSTPSLLSPEELVRREETLRSVTEAVFRLEEPFRTTLLLRFYDDLGLDEIAVRTGAPPGTVKSRLHRGLRRLRGMLDEAHGGRGPWLAALAPLAGVSLAETAAAATGTGLLSGALIMGIKVKIAGAAACVLGMVLVISSVLPSGERKEDGLGDGSAPADHLVTDETGDGIASASKDVKTADPGSEDGPASSILPVEPLSPVIRGRVTDKDSGDPVTAFDFEVCVQKSTKRTFRHHETVNDPDGRFEIPLPGADTYYVNIYSAEHQMKSILDIVIPRTGGDEELRIALDTDLSVTGCVKEGRTGRPLAGVLVVPVLHEYDDPGLIRYQEGREQCCIHALTDESGRFTLKGLLHGKQHIVALHPEYAQGRFLILDQWPEFVEIELHEGRSVFGTVYDDHGKPVPDIEITMVGETFPLARTCISGPDGTFRTEPALPGKLQLDAFPPTDAIAFTPECRVVTLEDRDLEVDFGIMKDYAVFRGTVFDADGTPCSSGNMFIHGDPRFPWPCNDHGYYRSERPLDETGRFEFVKVPAGRFKVSLHAPGKEKWIDCPPVTIPGPGLFEKDFHRESASLSGIVIDGNTGNLLREGYVSVKPRGERFSTYSGAILEDGSFQVTGVSPGFYDLSAGGRGEVRGTLKGVEVKSGRARAGLEIRTPVQGKVRIRISGFIDPENRRYGFTFRRVDRPSSGLGEAITSVDRNGDDEIQRSLRPGRWYFMVRFTTGGERRYAVRTFTVRAGKTSELSLSGDDLITGGRTFTVEGTLRREDGTPVPHAELEFKPTGFSPLADASVRRPKQTSRTSAGGGFTLHDAGPGLWNVTASLPDSSRMPLPGVVFPVNAASPFPLDLTIPSGVVTGTFRSLDPKVPLDPAGPAFTLRLRPEKGGFLSKSHPGGDGKTAFALDHVAPGRYRLRADVTGYGLVMTPPFTVEAGERIDLGEIGLSPRGVLILDIVDPEGKRIPYPNLFVNDERFRLDGEYSMTLLEDGGRRLNGLPLGTSEITVQATGFEERTVTVTLDKGNPTRMRITLDKPVQ